ncbi:MAG: signal peptidase I [Verrucomicrobiales bacterium]|nr:signal peptidase I [Verrucomicrobiales bacterium]
MAQNKSKPEKKEKEDPKANEPITRKHRKGGKQFLKDVDRFIRYNRDLIEEKNHAKIEAVKASFSETLTAEDTKRGELKDSAESLRKTCEKSVKGYQPSWWRENIESIFVVLLLVMAIRTYFLQPFKIPTGSMQPTLNGVIAYEDRSLQGNTKPDPSEDKFAPEGYETPGVLKQFFDKLWYGRTHINWVADRNLVIDPRSLSEKNRYYYFTRTYLSSFPDEEGRVKTFSAPGTSARIGKMINEELDRDPRTGGLLAPKGTVIARGFVDTGDQVFVDRFTYHWRKPKRGEVFVFNTRGIRGIEMSGSFDPRGGSQHYIKRLVAVPGDEVEVKAPNLYIDGEIAQEFGMQRVMAAEGDYSPGYTGNYGPQKLGPKQYWAMGDNSDSSFDSRGWGPVPEENIVGRGVFVFLPLGHHFGPIR